MDFGGFEKSQFGDHILIEVSLLNNNKFYCNFTLCCLQVAYDGSGGSGDGRVDSDDEGYSDADDGSGSGDGPPPRKFLF